MILSPITVSKVNKEERILALGTGQLTNTMTELNNYRSIRLNFYWLQDIRCFYIFWMEKARHQKTFHDQVIKKCFLDRTAVFGFRIINSSNV